MSPFPLVFAWVHSSAKVNLNHRTRLSVPRTGSKHRKKRLLFNASHNGKTSKNSPSQD
jgi:hypothetical protein